MTEVQPSSNIPEKLNRAVADLNRAVGKFALGALSFGAGAGITLDNFVLSQQPNTQASIAAAVAVLVGSPLLREGGIGLNKVIDSLNAHANPGLGQER